jgi:hypothetical protein
MEEESWLCKELLKLLHIGIYSLESSRGCAFEFCVGSGLKFGALYMYYVTGQVC